MENKPIVKIKEEGYGVNLGISTFLASVLTFIGALVYIFGGMSLNQNMLVFGILLLLYVIILPLSVRPRRIVYIKQTNDIVREKIVEVPVVKERIIEKKEAKRVLPPFVASLKTRTYHRGTCRLARLIQKDSFQGSEDSYKFSSAKYKKCKVCLDKK